jgi:hypothetical protein
MKYHIVPFTRIRFEGDWHQQPQDGGVFAYYPGTGACTIKLQKLAQRHGIALLGLHHTNKGEGTDVIARVSGSHGLTGAVDSVMLLSRHDGGARLAALPRDAEESAYGLERLTNGGWRMRQQAAIDSNSVSPDEDCEDSGTLGAKQQAVLALVRDGPKSYRQVAKLLSISDEAARKRLERMAKTGQVRKNPDGTFDATG